jgi:hypothetical protein
MKRSLLSIASLLILGACATREEANNRPAQNELLPTVLLESIESSPSYEKAEPVIQDIAFSTIKDFKDQEELRDLEKELNSPNRMPSQVNYTPEEENLFSELFNAKTVSAQKGDCLKTIASNFLGSSNEWPRLAKLNPQIKNPDKEIAQGEKIFIPSSRTIDPKKISAFEDGSPQESMIRGLASTDEVKILDPSKPLVDTTKDKAFFKPKRSSYKNPINDQIKEQVKISKFKKKKMKNLQNQSEKDREIASSEDDDDLENNVALHTHENLSKAIAALGILMMIAVFLSFFFSRPEKK